MTVDQPGVYTIGHSKHSLETFVSMLSRHRISAVADVRSAPFSRFSPHFNREPLAQSLKVSGINYVFLGRELGARSDDASMYEKGRVQYCRLAQTEVFKRGIERVMRGAEQHRIALLCAEQEPLECHRTLLVARALYEQGVAVTHILADGRLEPHENTMDRLLKLVGLPSEHLFLSREQLLEEAMSKQEEKIAYVDKDSVTAAAGAQREDLHRRLYQEVGQAVL